MPKMSDARISALYRYPVKGLSPERLPRVSLSAGEVFPHDRAYALENGPSGFDVDAPVHLPKIKFLMLMKQEKLAALKTAFDDADHVLTISENGNKLVSGSLRSEAGRRMIEDFFAERFAEDLRGRPTVLNVNGFSFSDVPEKCVSIINLESVRDLERKIGRPVDPLRFRGNIYLDGIPAWSEFDWLGKSLDAGGVSLSVFSRIQRCAATNVDPATGARDLQIPHTLTDQYGHRDCGIYATIGTSGVVTDGDTITVTKRDNLPF